MNKIVLVVLIIFISTTFYGEDKSKRPANWAKPIKMAGVPNLHKINNGLYRSAQPDAKGFKNLKKLGIKTIINLRSFHSNDDEIGKLKFNRVHMYVKAWHPEEKEAVRFLKIVTNPRYQPVLVHCQHGADRTGTMCALYRIAVQGWTKKQAIEEMTKGGYNYHSVWKNLIEWINKQNIKKLKKEAGIKNTK